MEIPLFLLNTVLHSGGRIELRVFEPRYMEMVKERLRANAPFGVCLIARGDETAAPGSAAAEPHEVGALASLVDWSMPQLGILNVVAHGGERFRIASRWTQPDGLMRAQVTLLPAAPVKPIPGEYALLVPMLRVLIGELESQPPQPHRYYDAAWVADRWAELLPLPLPQRQEILELDDGVARLDAIYRFLEKT